MRRIIINPDTKMVRLGGRPPRVTTVLLAVQIGLFLVYAFADGPAWVAKHLAVSAAQALGLFELWQPLTAVWIHLDARSILFNLLTLWVFGSALERWWGRRRFFVFWLVTGVAGLVLAMLVGMASPLSVVSGSAGAAMGMMLAFGLLFPNHLAFFYGVLPLKAKWLALIVAGFVVIGNLISVQLMTLAVEAGGALAALLFLFSPSRLAKRAQERRAARKLRVIDGGKAFGGTNGSGEKKEEPKYWN